MPLIPILVTLVLLGAAIAIVQLLPIDGTVKRIIYIVMVVAVILWVLGMFVPMGNWGALPHH
jgi:hypothetical protein